MVHGYGCQLSLEPVARFLNLHGFDAISFDLPGFGYSGGKRFNTTLEDVVQVIWKFLDEINANYNRPRLICKD